MNDTQDNTHQGQTSISDQAEPTDCYREKYVAFIDMLGFGHRVKASAHDPIERKGIIEAIELLRDTACPIPQVGLLITYFSDCIVLSADPNPHGLHAIFQAIVIIADNLIQRDVLIRGGITHGGIYHDDDLCFGPAMVRAYEIESKEAKNPCVVLDNDVYEAASNCGLDGDWLIFDGEEVPQRRYLNYLRNYTNYDGVPRLGGMVQTEPAQLIRHTIVNRILSEIEDISSKGTWMGRYWDEIVAASGILPSIDIEADRDKPKAMASRVKLMWLASS